MFWRKKPIVIKFYTTNSAAYAYAKPNFGSKSMPEWWKKLEAPDTSVSTDTNMKFCVGLTSYFKKGIVIPAWCDITVDTTTDGDLQYKFYDEKSTMLFHGIAQRGSFASQDNFIHGKIKSQWTIVCDDDVEFHYNTPIWSYENPNTFRTLPGVINFKYQFSSNINLLFDIPTESNYRTYIHKNTPLAIMHPLSERPVKLEHFLITEEEHEKMFPSYKTATMWYYKRKKLLESEKENKCPFGFGGKK